jgi:hypothetical protein
MGRKIHPVFFVFENGWMNQVLHISCCARSHSNGVDGPGGHRLDIRG